MSTALRLWAMAVVMALGVFAQKSDKPDFSGTWQLDLPLTRFGQLPPPKSLVLQIEHREPQIRIVMIATTDNGETRDTLELTTDGKPRAQTLQGQSCSATAQWDWWSGKRLIVEVRRPGSLTSRRFTLGAKGKILTTILTVKEGPGEKKAYEFFTRQ